MRPAGVAGALGALLAAGLLAAVVVLAGLDGGATAGRGGANDGDDDGWLALYLLFEELGFAPEPWSAPLSELPAGRHALWWGDAPPAPGEPQAQSTAQERPPDAHDLWLARNADGPLHLRRFLVQGGRLVAAPEQATLDWLAQRAGLAELEGARFQARVRAPGPARGPGGERFELETAQIQQLVDLAPDVACEVLLSDADGEALAVEIAVGRGSIVFPPTVELFDNATLRRGDAARFAVRLAESLAPGGRLLFDEGLRSRGEAPELGALLAGPTLRLASMHAALLALLALWLALAPRDFGREPRRSERVSALERARARAALALRAGRASALAAPLREGVLRRAARRLRVRLGDGEASAQLAALASAAGPRLDLERWTRAWTRVLPDDPEALAELDRELRALESGLSGAHDAHTPPDAPAHRHP